MKMFFKNALLRIADTLKNEKGFTLIEIMVVVTIIAIIGAIAVPRLLDLPKRARVTAAKTQIKEFQVPLQLYSQDKGHFPSTEEGLQAIVNENLMKKVPKDPWGNDYQYRSPGESDPDYEIWSFGGDGREGGDGFNADIKSWED